MKRKVRIKLPPDKTKPTTNDMVFQSKDGITNLNFDEWFDEFIRDNKTIQKLKNGSIKDE